MLLRASNHCASLVIMSMIALAPCARVVAQDDHVLSAPRYWWQIWAVPPWISLAGDADGDGRADLIAVEPGGTIAVARTSPLGKCVNDPSRNNPFAGDLIAAAAARFTGGTADEVLGLARDGSLYLASQMTRGTSKYCASRSRGPRSRARGSAAGGDPRLECRSECRRSSRRARPMRRRAAPPAAEPARREWDAALHAFAR